MLFISPPFSNYLTFLPGTMPIKGSFTLKQRKGLIKQIFKTLRYSKENKGWINKIGLRNKGIDNALKTYNNKQILSIAILEESDLEKFNQKIPQNTNIEINISCPNAAVKIPTQLGQFINENRQWCVIKLGPNTSNETIDSLYQLGFRQFHCCNTIPTDKGGLSGPMLIPFVLQKIQYIKQNYNDTIVIAGGGIQNMDVLKQYQNQGADHFAISTICFNPFKLIKFYFDYQFQINYNSISNSKKQ